MSFSRRQLFVRGSQAGAALFLAPLAPGLTGRASASVGSGATGARERSDLLFDISLAQWSLHRTLRGGELDAIDFPVFAKTTCGIDAVEYVNSFFKDKAGDFGWLGEMRKRAEGEGVKSVLIMIDGEGRLAAGDDAERRKAIENHFRWIAAAGFLGCHAIRVNAAGEGDWDADRERAADSLRRLAVMGEPYGISVIVENHGGLSSNGEWLASVMKTADHPGVGTLPDFGNFSLGNGEWYDRYEGVTELMPYAKAVSAKSHEFDADGNEVRTDYRKMMRIVLDAGYHGYVGVEWEGDGPSEVEGIGLTKRLLETVRDEIASAK